VPVRGAPFLEQRLLPVRMVRLVDPLQVGNRSVAAGTPLYLVFNSRGAIAWCTVKDRSAGRLFPFLNQRPCFTDSNGDGRLDSSFSVFDRHGGPPSVRGSIDAAQPLGASAAVAEADIHD
jgi:hypothetical protein